MPRLCQNLRYLPQIRIDRTYFADNAYRMEKLNPPLPVRVLLFTPCSLLAPFGGRSCRNPSTVCRFTGGGYRKAVPRTGFALS
jgi:hypothetical protein